MVFEKAQKQDKFSGGSLPDDTCFEFADFRNHLTRSNLESLEKGTKPQHLNMKLQDSEDTTTSHAAPIPVDLQQVCSTSNHFDEDSCQCFGLEPSTRPTLAEFGTEHAIWLHAQLRSVPMPKTC